MLRLRLESFDSFLYRQAVDFETPPGARQAARLDPERLTTTRSYYMSSLRVLVRTEDAPRWRLDS